MSLKLGNGLINKMYLGPDEILKAYLGPLLVYDKTTSPNGLLNGLVSYYKADTNGSFPDAHGTNPGTINGATYTASGKINGGYSFDGVNDYISLGNTISATEGSISLWYKPTRLYDFNTIFDNLAGGNIWEMWIYSTGLLRARPGSTFCSSSFLLSTNVWYNIVLTWENGGNLILYINGSSQESSTYTTTSASTVYLGGGNASNTNGEGVVDEIGFWNRVLTQSEITELYNGGNGLGYGNFTT